MPREARGGVIVLDGVRHARFTIEPGKRIARAIGWATDEENAQEWADALQALAHVLRSSGRTAVMGEAISRALNAGKADPVRGLAEVKRSVAALAAERSAASILSVPSTPRGGMTFRKFAERWTSGELHKLYPDHVNDKRTADDDVSRLEKYIYPVLGSLLACTGSEDKRPPRQPHPVRLPLPRGDALERSPFPQWGDLDLEHGAVRLDENKTDDPRAWALDPSVVLTLKWWRERVPHEDSDPVFARILNPGHLADTFRAHLQLAGVKRLELFERSKARRPIRIHDCRATFITLALANGKTEAWVTARTGHKSSAQVAAYRRGRWRS